MTSAKKESSKPKKAKTSKSAAPAAASPKVFVGTIGRIGWDNENTSINLVAIDKRTREKLGVQQNSVVKCKKSGTNVVKTAMVVMQFKAFVGTNSASVNTTLAAELGLAVNDKLEITGEGILESEADAIRLAARSAAIAHIRELAAIVNAARARTAENNGGMQ